MKYFQNILIPVLLIIQQFEITTIIKILITIRDQSVQNYDKSILVKLAQPNQKIY
jgi:hypothetical protein